MDQPTIGTGELVAHLRQELGCAWLTPAGLNNILRYHPSIRPRVEQGRKRWLPEEVLALRAVITSRYAQRLGERPAPAQDGVHD